jgi:hypothetical protein
MIWDVKIYLAKIKDGKGKNLAIASQENFAHNNPANLPPGDQCDYPYCGIICSKSGK